MKKLILVLGFLGSFSFSFGFTGDTTVLFEGGSITKEQKESIKRDILSVIEKNYGEVTEYEGFDLAISDYVTKKLTGKVNLNNFDLPDYFFSVNFEVFPDSEIIKEITQERITSLKEKGLPITPDRFLIRTIERDGKAFIVVALDETYIAPVYSE